MELDIKQDINLLSLTGLGQSGLYNLGNTCFLNTAIQCLSSVKLLSAYFISDQYKEDLNLDKNEEKFVEEYARLIKVVWRDNCSIRPLLFKKTLGEFYDPYIGFRQNDSAEAYCKIIELLHEGLTYEVQLKDAESPPVSLYDKIKQAALVSWKNSYENNYSIILKLFYGQFCSRIKCDNCKNVSKNFDPFSIINLPVDEKTNTLEDCINRYVVSEDMHGDNTISCEKCKKKCTGKRKTTVWRMPPVLSLCFNRFDDRGRKINKYIDFPLKCNFSNLVEKPSDKKSIYELVAISNHSGGLLGGHYWAYGKGTNGNWYEYNDSTVNEIELSSLVSNNAYYLIYVKKGLTTEVIIS